jgi:hypothetical protein
VGAVVTKDLILTIGHDQSVSTLAATNIGKHAHTYHATLNGTLVGLGNKTWVSLSFQWGLTTGYTGGTLAAGTPAQPMHAPGAFSVDTGNIFAENTSYHYRIKAVANDGTIVYGPDQVLSPPG